MKYEEAEFLRSAIMQDFRDDEKKIKMAAWWPFWILQICHGLSLCEILHFFYFRGPAILHFFELSKYHKIIKI